MEPSYLDNLLRWTGQVMVIASAGLILPVVMRVRHPRTQLLYCHILLAVSLLLPFLQPWRHPLILAVHQTPITSTMGPVFAGAHAAIPRVSWIVIVFWILVGGVAAKLCWLAAGLWRVSSYRATAIPLFPIPAAVETASALSQTGALVCISSATPGPVTLGFLHPVVLLPESFLALGEEAQCAIACHELLHVRRHDWLVTVMEEFAGALLWFNPAVWWLLAQTRLVREQVVDEEVVHLTTARDPYVAALLTLAGGRAEPDLAPAPSFLRRRHLTYRVHHLLKEVSMSKKRLLISYTSIATVLVLATWFALATLPLVGRAQVKEADAPEQAGVRVDPGGTILHRVAIPYPQAARSHHIKGTIVTQLTLGKNGEVADARVVSGPEELRGAVLWSVLQWRYATDGQSPQTVQVTVDFQAPNAVSPTPSNPQIEAMANSREAHGILASIDVSALPEPQRSAVWEKVKAFERQPTSNYQMRQIESAVFGVDKHIACDWRILKDGTGQTLTLFLSPRFGHPSFSQLSPEPAVSSQTADQFPSSGTPRVLMEGGAMAGKVLHKVEPAFPPQAQAAGIRGTVVLDVLIASDGSVAAVHVVDGPAALRQSAVDAVKQWTYEQTIVDGAPVEVISKVQVPFGLNQ